jgi:hypothetical protein
LAHCLCASWRCPAQAIALAQASANFRNQLARTVANVCKSLAIPCAWLLGILAKLPVAFRASSLHVWSKFPCKLPRMFGNSCSSLQLARELLQVSSNKSRLACEATCQRLQTSMQLIWESYLGKFPSSMGKRGYLTKSRKSSCKFLVHVSLRRTFRGLAPALRTVLAPRSASTTMWRHLPSGSDVARSCPVEPPCVARSPKSRSSGPTDGSWTAGAPPDASAFSAAFRHRRWFVAYRTRSIRHIAMLRRIGNRKSPGETFAPQHLEVARGKGLPRASSKARDDGSPKSGRPRMPRQRQLVASGGVRPMAPSSASRGALGANASLRGGRSQGDEGDEIPMSLRGRCQGI